MRQWVEIRLKVVDNAAYTSLLALRRLGLSLSRVQRARFVGSGEPDALERVRRDQALFSVNLHKLRTLDADAPAPGEIWIAPRDEFSHGVNVWRLFDDRGNPASREMLERARDVLLCNPAIEEATLPP